MAFEVPSNLSCFLVLHLKQIIAEKCLEALCAIQSKLVLFGNFLERCIVSHIDLFLSLYLTLSLINT